MDTEAFDSVQMLATSMAAAIGREAGYSGAPALLRRPSDLQAYIEEMGALLGLGLVVVDGDGKALAVAPPELEGAALLAQGIGVARMAADAGSPLRLRLPTGDRPDEARWLAEKVPVEREGGDGALLVDYSHLYETIWMRDFLFILPLTGIAMVVVALALGIGLSTSRRIVKPLQTLRASARDLGKGRLDDPIRVSSGDEVEDLAWTLDEVRLELKQARKATEGEIAVRRRAEQELQQAHTRLTRWVKDLNERTQEMSLLSQMSDLLQSCHVLEEAYPIVSRFAGQLFPEEPGAVYMMDPSKRLVVAAARWGPRPPDGEAFAPDQCWALRRGQIHRVRSPDEGPICGHVERFPQYGYLCAPMMAHGEALGLLHMEYCNSIPGGDIPAAGCLDGAAERLVGAIA
ncbi:MAG: HAMP domain-containing protein, partial [Chloroflexota bacterium]|nr:HAMP domain-containing protein [Chloroflexota bacterium]